MIAFTVYGDPRPQARARMTKTGHVYTPKGSSDYRTRVRNAATEAMQEELRTEIMKGPVCVFVKVVKQSRVSGWIKAERAWLNDGGLMLHDKKPDADNVLKQVCDACNGVVWVDDSQVAIATAVKCHGRESRVDVWVWKASKIFWSHESIEDFVELTERNTNG